MFSQVKQFFETGNRFSRLNLGTALVLALVLTTHVGAQQSSPVVVNDSPWAWELYQQAADQVAGNAGEAARICQQLLDDYPLKLLPAAVGEDRFVSVRRRVNGLLRSDDDLLARYRSIETSAAERMLEADELEQLAVTRLLTEPGLEATMQLAQRDLESARFEAALNWLGDGEGHPDLIRRRAAHFWLMTAIAAHYSGNDARREQAQSMLDQIDFPNRALLQRYLTGIIALGEGPQTLHGISTLDAGLPVATTVSTWHRIWSMPLQATPYVRRFALGALSVSDQRARERAESDGVLLSTVVTVANEQSEIAYVNEGFVVRAFDRFNREQLWSTRIGRLTGRREDGTIGDLNIVASNDQYVVALAGHAFPAQRSGGATLVCLNASDGSLRWERRFDELDDREEFDGLFPYGAPILQEGRIFIPARKVTRRLETVCYCLAFDADNGQLQWSQFVCSSSGARFTGLRPYTNLLYRDGALYLTSAVGAMARLDATTGMFDWLARFDVPVRRVQVADQPWEIGRPAVTDEKVIALLPNQRRVAVLDRATGTMQASYPIGRSEPWGQPRYFLTDDEWVYAVGETIVAFHTDRLDTAAWRLRETLTRPESPSSQPMPIVGRVQLADAVLVVPGERVTLFVDARTGWELQRVQTGQAGNPLATGPQLLIAGNDRLEAFMPLDRAEQMFRRRMTDAPDDPERPLALLNLARQAGDFELALEAASMTLETIEHTLEKQPEAVQAKAVGNRLFDMLLEIAGSEMAATVEQAVALHEVIASAAADPGQRVTALLAEAEMLTAYDRIEDAVANYQRILSKKDLATARYTVAGVVRPAELAASERLGELIRAHGRAIYQFQADRAQRQFDTLVKADAPPAELLAIAAEYPPAEAALEATMLAAEKLLQHDQPRLAYAALASAYRRTTTDSAGQRMLEAMLQLCTRQRWTSQAKRLLTLVDGDRRQIMGIDFVEHLASRRTRSPQIGDEASAEGTRLDGSLVPGHQNAPPDRMLLSRENELAMISSDGLAELWAASPGKGSPRVLSFTRDRLLVFFDEPGVGRVVQLDPDDGTVLWTSPDLRESLPVLGILEADGRRRTEKTPTGEQFVAGEIFSLTGPGRVVTLSALGDAAAFGTKTNDDSPLWARQDLLDRVYDAAICDLGIAVAGRTMDSESGEPIGLVIVLDPETGETRLEFPTTTTSLPAWIAFDPLGAIVIATRDGVEMHELPVSETAEQPGLLWANTSPLARETSRGWLLGEAMVVQAVEHMASIDLSTGLLSDRFEPPPSAFPTTPLRSVLRDEYGVVLHFAGNVLAFDDFGAFLGRDAVFDNFDERDFRFVAVSTTRIAAVQYIEARQIEGRNHYFYSVYLLDREAGCKLVNEGWVVPVVGRPVTDMKLINDWLLLSTNNSTHCIELSNKQQE